jgi:hypothetical protein
MLTAVVRVFARKAASGCVLFRVRLATIEAGPLAVHRLQMPRLRAAPFAHEGGKAMREVRWTSEEGEGIEHLAFDARDDGFFVESALVGQRYGKSYGLYYRVRCDPRWRVNYAYLKVMGGGELELHGDGEGHWRDGHGLVLSAIEGCIDIDIAATPFTNTLPIRRLPLAEGERQPIAVAYIVTPDLQVTRADQAYTCIELNREYRYEGIFRDFAANLKIDDDGLVIDYPTLFTRLPRMP